MPDTHQVSYGIRLEARTVRHSPLGDTTHAGPSSLWSTPASGIQHPRRRHQAAAPDSRTSPPRPHVSEDAVSSHVNVASTSRVVQGPRVHHADCRQLKIQKQNDERRERERAIGRTRGYRRTTTVWEFRFIEPRAEHRAATLAGHSRRDAFELVYIFPPPFFLLFASLPPRRGPKVTAVRERSTRTDNGIP